MGSRRPQEPTEFDKQDLLLKGEDLFKRLSELSSLSRVAAAIASSLDLKVLLRSALEEIRRCLDFSAGGVWLYDEQHEELWIAAALGMSDEHIALRIPRGFSVVGWVAETGQRFYVPDVTKEPRIKPLMKHLSLRSCMYAPLRMGEEIFGAIVLGSTQIDAYNPAQLSFLSTLANQVAAAIANANAYKQIEQLAILEERDRIARELHDGLAQTLGCLTVDAELIQSLLAEGDLTRACRELSRMRVALQGTYGEVREFMDGLRTKVSDSGGFIPALDQCIHDFRDQSGIEAHLEIIGGNLQLSPLVELHLLRIVQEGLANVRKHSHADQARVKLEMGTQELELVIEDNGRGFDLNENKRGHLGLNIMRERVDRLSGHFRVESELSSGTKVIVRIPNPERWR